MLRKIRDLYKFFAQVLADLFWSKIDIELSQLGFVSSMASELKNLFIHQSNSKHTMEGTTSERKECDFLFDMLKTRTD